MIEKIVINNIDYDVDDGVVISDKATEELDTLTFTLTNVNEIQLEPFQQVKVYFNDLSKNYKSFILILEEKNFFSPKYLKTLFFQKDIRIFSELLLLFNEKVMNFSFVRSIT